MPMYPYLDKTLKFSAENIGLAYASTGIAAMISPFIVGMIADRFFATQKVFGVLHLLGGVFLLVAASAESWGMFFSFRLLHVVC